MRLRSRRGQVEEHLIKALAKVLCKTISFRSISVHRKPLVPSVDAYRRFVICTYPLNIKGRHFQNNNFFFKHDAVKYSAFSETVATTTQQRACQNKYNTKYIFKPLACVQRRTLSTSRDDLHRLRFRVKKDGKFVETTASTYDALEEWFFNYDGQRVWDTRMTLAGQTFDPAKFALLDPDVVHTLTTKRPKHQFDSFKTYASVKSFAKLKNEATLDTTFGAEFSEFADNEGFDRDVKLIVELLLDNMDAFGVDTNEMATRDYIIPFLKAATCLVNEKFLGDSSSCSSCTPPMLNNDTNTTKDAVLPSTRVSLDYKQWLQGSKACGMVDFLLYAHHSILTVMETKKWGQTTSDSLYQALTVMLVTREETHRSLCSFSGADSVAIQQELDQVPTLGVISTGDSWRFVKYIMKPNRHGKMHGYITHSTDFPLLLDPAAVNKKLLIQQVGPILNMLCGVLLHELKSSVSLEEKVKAMN